MNALSFERKEGCLLDYHYRARVPNILTHFDCTRLGENTPWYTETGVTTWSHLSTPFDSDVTLGCAAVAPGPAPERRAPGGERGRVTHEP